MKKGSGYDQSYRGWILYPSLYLCLRDDHLLQRRSNNPLQKEIMETIDTIAKIVNTIVLSIVVLLFVAGVFYQVIELTKKK